MSHCVDDGNSFSHDFLLDINSFELVENTTTVSRTIPIYSSLTRSSSKLYLNKMSDFPPNPQNLALILHETLIKFKLMSCIRLLSWQIKHLIQHSTYHERNELDFLWSCSNIWIRFSPWAYSRVLRWVRNCDDSQDNSNILPLLGSVPGDYYIPRFLTTRVMIATPGYKWKLIFFTSSQNWKMG